jgi:uncharacterized protein (DUF305 family)
MQKISASLAVSLIIVSTIIGIVIGYSLTPSYTLSMYDKSGMDLGRADRGLDLRYINAMIAHHRGAILLAEQAKDMSQRQEIKNLTADILKNEPTEIQELYDWKKAWYGDTKTVRDPIVSKLWMYDEKYDLRFLNALIAHHEDGLLMTRDIRTKSSRMEILNNADAVDTFFITTLEVFKWWRKEWYKI